MRLSLFKNHSKIIQFLLRHKYSVTVLLLIIIFSTASAGLYFKSLSSTERVAFVRSNTIIQKTLPILRTIRKTSDILYLPYFFKKNNLETYHLQIDQDILREMEESLPPPFADAILTDEFKKWRKAKLIAPTGEEFKVETRYRGDNSIHWDSRKKSITVRFKDGIAHDGMKRISFIIPHDRNFVFEEMQIEQSRKLGIPEPKTDFANLVINGKPQGLYYVAQGWDESFLAANNLSEETNFYGLKEAHKWFGELDIIFDDLTLWKKYTSDIKSAVDDYSYTDLFLESMNEWPDDKLYAQIFDIIDEENFFAWLIAQNLASSTHENGVNLRMVHDNVTGKLKFITWDVGLYAPRLDVVSTSPLINRLLMNEKYMHKRNLLIWDYITREDGIEDDLNYFDKQLKRIKPALYKDRNKIYSNRWADKKIKDARDRYVAVVEHIKEELKTARALVNITTNPDSNAALEIMVTVDNPSDLYLDTLDLDEVDLGEGKYELFYDTDRNGVLSGADQKVGTFSQSSSDFTQAKDVLLFSTRELPNGAGNTLVVKKTEHAFFVVGPSGEADWSTLKVRFRNAVTGKKVDKDNVTRKFINGSVFDYFEDISANWEAIRSRHSFLAKTFVVDNKIIFPAGHYIVNQTFIIPKGYTVEIRPGAVFIISKNASIISYSKVIATSATFTAENQNDGWGTFTIVDVKGESKIKNSIFEYGGEGFVNGIPSTGTLSLFESPGTISGSTFRYAKGDDGLNLKRSQGTIAGNLFYKNEFDALDLDWNNSMVDGNIFIENGNDSVDISSSKPLIKNNYIFDSGDKGVSVGENSQAVIFNNIIQKANIGIASKDLSKPLVFNNNIIKTDQAVSAYQKKEIFGGSHPFLFNTVLQENKQNFVEDEKSQITSKKETKDDAGITCDTFGFCTGEVLKDGKAYEEMLEWISSETAENTPIGILDEQSIRDILKKHVQLVH